SRCAASTPPEASAWACAASFRYVAVRTSTCTAFEKTRTSITIRVTTHNTTRSATPVWRSRKGLAACETLLVSLIGEGSGRGLEKLFLADGHPAARPGAQPKETARPGRAANPRPSGTPHSEPLEQGIRTKRPRSLSVNRGLSPFL